MSIINDNVLVDPFSVKIEESDEISEALDYTDILVEVSRALGNYIKKVLIRKKQYNEINLNKDYIYKVMNNNTKTYYFKDYTLINFEKQKNELNYSYKIS